MDEWARAYTILQSNQCFQTDQATFDRDKCTYGIQQLAPEQVACLYGSGTLQSVCSKFDEQSCRTIPKCQAQLNNVPKIDCGDKPPAVPRDKASCTSITTCGDNGLWVLSCPGEKNDTTNYYRTVPEQTQEGGYRCSWSQKPDTVQPDADTCAIYTPPDPCPRKTPTDPTQPQHPKSSSGDISKYWILGSTATLSLAAIAVLVRKRNKPVTERMSQARHNVVDAHYMNRRAPVFLPGDEYDVDYEDEYILNDRGNLFRTRDGFDTAKSAIRELKDAHNWSDDALDMYNTLKVIESSLSNYPMVHDDEGLYVTSFLRDNLEGACGSGFQEFFKKFGGSGDCREKLFDIDTDEAKAFVDAVKTRHASSLYAGRNGMYELFRLHDINMDASEAYVKLHNALGLGTPATNDPYQIGWDIAQYMTSERQPSNDMVLTVASIKRYPDIYRQREVQNMSNAPKLTAAGYVRRTLSENVAFGSGVQRTMAGLPLLRALARVRHDHVHTTDTLSVSTPLPMFSLDRSHEVGSDDRQEVDTGDHRRHGSE